MGKKGEKTACPSCGHKETPKSTVSLSEKVKKKETIEVIDPSSAAEIHPKTDVDCPECGHKKAHYWTQQTRAGDEPETQFFKCAKCKHQWREYR